MEWKNKIFKNHSDREFEDLAFEVFRYQMDHCEVYYSFVNSVRKKSPRNLNEIPFIPISLFKTHKIITDKTPNIDGSTLDNVIDYLNYVIIPSLMVYWFQLVPPGWEIVIPARMFLVSLYTFANLNMKTSDYYFSGFPAVWNIAVLYFYILGTNEWINLCVIIFFYILTFIPIKFVHPLRVKKLRNLTIFATILWSATTLKLVTTKPEINLFSTEKIVMFIWIVCSIYFAYVCLNR